MDRLTAGLQRLRDGGEKRSRAADEEDCTSPQGGSSSSGLKKNTEAFDALLRQWTLTTNSPTCKRARTRHPSLATSSQEAKENISVSRTVHAQQPRVQPQLLPSTTQLPPLLDDTMGYVARMMLLPSPAAPAACSARPTASNLSSSSSSNGVPKSTAYTPFSCVVIDLETTGFSPYDNEILEVGCVELRWTPPRLSRPTVDDVVLAEASTGAQQLADSPVWVDVDALSDSEENAGGSSSSSSGGCWSRGPRRFHRYVRPSSRAAMSAAATAVHGITWERVKGSPRWPAVAEELASFLHGIAMGNDTAASASSADINAVPCTELLAVQLPPLVAHNAAFDTAFLEHQLRCCGYHVVWHARYPSTCTMQWVKRSYPHVKFSLDGICAYLRTDGAEERAGRVHSAVVDATLTANLFVQLCRLWEERMYAPGQLGGEMVT